MTALQRKIETLTKSQQAEVLRFIEEVLEKRKPTNVDKFDQEIERDALSGKLEVFASKAIEDYKRGKYKGL